MSKSKNLHYYINQYIKFKNQHDNLDNYYRLKKTTTMDYTKLKMLDQLEVLKARKVTALRLLVQFVKENLC